MAVFAVLAIAAPASAPATAPAVADPALAAKLVDIDARAGKIKDFTAQFEQKKFTALLKRPLVSSGTIRVVGPVVRWDTDKPDPAVLYSDGREVRMYYPKQKSLEVYAFDRRMADLARSPLPRLANLHDHFSFEPMAVREAAGDFPDLAEAPGAVALRLKPTDAFMKEHVDEVRVLLDARSATMLCVQTIDADGDRTAIRFADVKLDTGLDPSALALKVPADTKVSRPLDAAGGGQ
jgi:outer membrane lipoprotein-sorting protein